MPSNRSKRTRSRRAASLTGAQLLWLTGDAQGQHVNKFELLGLEHPSRPADFERIRDLLDRAGGIVSAERIEQLRQQIAST